MGVPATDQERGLLADGGGHVPRGRAEPLLAHLDTRAGVSARPVTLAIQAAARSLPPISEVQHPCQADQGSALLIVSSVTRTAFLMMGTWGTTGSLSF